MVLTLRFPLYALLLAVAVNLGCFPCEGWVPPPVQTVYPTSTTTTTTTTTPTTTTCLHMAAGKKRNLMDYNVDYYRVLNVTRGASQEDISKNYQIYSRLWSPTLIYQQTPELQFTPSSLRVKELKEYLEDLDVSTATCIDKQDLVDLAKKVYARTQKVNPELQSRRQPNEDRYKLLEEAYEVLSDTEERRRYNLSGDWGVSNDLPALGIGGGVRFVSGKVVDLVDQGFDLLEDKLGKKKKK